MSRQGKASLLLVDDDPDLLRLLAIRLKANGYGVTAVDSAQRALASYWRPWSSQSHTSRAFVKTRP